MKYAERREIKLEREGKKECIERRGNSGRRGKK